MVNEPGVGVTIRDVGRITYGDLEQTIVLWQAGEHDLALDAAFEPTFCSALASRICESEWRDGGFKAAPKPAGPTHEEHGLPRAAIGPIGRALPSLPSPRSSACAAS